MSHAKTVAQVLQSHNVDPAKGLTLARVEKLREEHGRNELDKEEGTPLWKVRVFYRCCCCECVSLREQ